MNYQITHLATIDDSPDCTIHTFRAHLPASVKTQVWSWVATASGGDYAICPDGTIRTIDDQKLGEGYYAQQIQQMFDWLLENSLRKDHR